MSTLVDANDAAMFLPLLKAKKLPEPVSEYRFAAPERQWRFDLAWPKHKVALEIEGGVFKRGGGGRHNRGAGFRNDLEKYSEAAVRGWTVIRVLPEQLCELRTLQWVERALEVE